MLLFYFPSTKDERKALRREGQSTRINILAPVSSKAVGEKAQRRRRLSFPSPHQSSRGSRGLSARTFKEPENSWIFTKKPFIAECEASN